MKMKAGFGNIPHAGHPAPRTAFALELQFRSHGTVILALPYAESIRERRASFIT